MESKEFKITGSTSSITIENNGNSITIRQAVDNDILFSTSEDRIDLTLCNTPFNHEEQKAYLVFESLMKGLTGRYILKGDYQKKCSTLPEDFIDCKSKMITWHSDGSTDSTLSLAYHDGAIRISIYKGEGAKPSHNNIVRIRTAGSDYGGYYKEFLYFFDQLCALADSLNNPVETTKKHEEETNRNPFSLLKRFIKKRGSCV